MEDKKILLVDDSATALMMEKMILKGTTFELVVAKDGREALDVAAAELELLAKVRSLLAA